MTAEEERVLRARIAELETEREKMLPIYEAHLRTLKRIEQDRARIATLSEFDQHREQCHAAYEYACTTNARKSGESPMPEGDGWEANNIIPAHQYKDGIVQEECWCNWTRDAFTETNYWRRKRS